MKKTTTGGETYRWRGGRGTAAGFLDVLDARGRRVATVWGRNQLDAARKVARRG